MNVEVLIPFRASTRERAENMWRTVTHFREAMPGVPIRLADDLGTPFSRAGSINSRVRDSSADVFVAADADVMVPADQLAAAVEMAAREKGVVQPFDEYLYSSPKGRNRILEHPGWVEGVEIEWDVRPSGKIPLVGACNVFSRETWEATGGMLELRGWGCQDVCWDAMCQALVAPIRRVPGALVHLWHPHDDDTRQAGNAALVERRSVMETLLAARHDEAAMRVELERLGHALPPAR